MSTAASRPQTAVNAPKSHHPDTVLHNGTIHLLDRPGHVTSALAIKGEWVLAVGDDASMIDLAGPNTAMVDLNRMAVLPGLTDAHIHLMKFAQALAQVECGTATPQACLDAVAVRAAGLADPDAWILGHGWDQNVWGQFPHKDELDAASGPHPAYLTAKSLHAGWANSAALTLAGIGQDTANPPGGVIQRDDSGRLTGILFESAMGMVGSKITQSSGAALTNELALAQEKLWEFGLTGIHDFDGVACFVAIQELREQRRLGLRVVKNVLADDLRAAIDAGLRTGFGDSWIRIGNVKVFADGALGPHTAAMLQPYESEPDNLGVLLKDEEEIISLATVAADAGLGMTIHAIGDRANHAVLNAYEALREYEEAHRLSHRRHRIEHVQLLHPDDIDRLRALDLVASMQPIHALSDRTMADHFWGDRVSLAYAWKTQLDRGTSLAFGSDAPVESPDPFLGIYAAVTRRPLPDQRGLQPWHPEQAIPLWDALQAYTAGPAFAGHQEDEAGCLLPGRLADLIVTEQDVFALPANQLLHVNVVGTMVGGAWRMRQF